MYWGKLVSVNVFPVDNEFEEYRMCDEDDPVGAVRKPQLFRLNQMKLSE